MAVLIKVEIMWKKCKNCTEEKIILEQARIGFIISVLYVGLLTVTFFGYTLEPIIKYSIISWIPENKSVEKGVCIPFYFTSIVENYYWILFCYTLILTTIIIATISILNYFQISVTKFIVGMFKIIGHDMVHMHEKLELTSEPLQNEQIMEIINKRIRTNIQRHQETIELFKAFQKQTNMKYFIIVILIISELSLAGFWSIVVLENNKLYALKMIATMISTMMILLYLIYSSEDLMNACDRLNQNCFDSKWYLFKVKERRLILLMILRTANPCTLTAGPTVQMNYETSAIIVKMVISYLMAFYRIMGDAY
ncbi:hypothetical protein TKK_0005301 [Trichogramma kaykai]